MQRTSFRKVSMIAALLAVAVCASGADKESRPVESAGKLRVGQAEIAFSANENGKLKMAQFPGAVEQAYKLARQRYGEGTPKVVLVQTNVRAGIAKQIAFIHDKYAAGAPLYGVGTGSDSYSIVGQSVFLGKKQPGMSVLFLGGDITIQPAVVTDFVMPVKDWNIKDEAVRAAEKKKHAEWGRELARQVKPVAGKTNVFLQLGTQHVPRMSWVHVGTTEVLGEKVYIAGGAAADHGFIFDKGKTVPNALLGILISGDFRVALVGSDKVPEPKMPTVLREKLTDVTRALGVVPELTMYFACVSWRHGLEQQKQAVNEVLGTAPLFGAGVTWSTWFSGRSIIPALTVAAAVVAYVWLRFSKRREET